MCVYIITKHFYSIHDQIKEFFHLYLGFVMMRSLINTLVLIVFVVILSPILSRAESPAIYILGDSLFDVGTNTNLLKSLAKANFPWYGVDFFNSTPNGRFSNGQNMADFTAVEELPEFCRERLCEELNSSGDDGVEGFDGTLLEGMSMSLAGLAEALVRGGVTGAAGEMSEWYMQVVVAGTVASGKFSRFVYFKFSDEGKKEVGISRQDF
ncbi:hypothetical protein L1887_35071 [Cichorium endivia]|nr:hypothetical protein L1887_35071 [Cichorium endivia]